MLASFLFGFIDTFIQYLLDIFITSDNEQNLSLRSSFSAGNTDSNPHHRAVESPLPAPHPQESGSPDSLIVEGRLR